MPLVFGAICPHPPILIPAIGQKNLKRIKKTQKAMNRLADDFYHASPETVIIISPHAQMMAESFIINHSPSLIGDFNDFGDLETKLEFKNDLGLAYQIRKAVETKIPLILTDDQKLDHGSLVPLYYLSQQKKDMAVIPLGYSLLGRDVHYQLGQAIKKILNHTNKRVAVIASGDLSHRLSQDAPAGFSSKGKEFDKKIIDLLKNKKHQEILTLDEELIKDAAECGYRSILIL
ncbi:AmmeMemoRadiSam system protein B, partial [Patescibacteria group bacterium]|nr:AmmeMemoRadiSam system protein B [Patescibacteria group bacterium]